MSLLSNDMDRISRGPSIDHSFSPDSAIFHRPSRSDDSSPSIDFGPLSDEDARLRPEDDFDIFDLELVTSVGGKTTELSFRKRNTTGISSARPTYKVEKKTISHLFGKKKNMSIVIQRNEGLSAINPTQRGSRRGSKGYSTIFECNDENTRQATLDATSHCVLSDTPHGSRLSLTPFLDNFDPQNSRPPRRESTSYHFFPLIINEIDGQQMRHPSATSHLSDPQQPPPYLGGGHFVFDAKSLGRSELLFTLWCTRYEKRSVVLEDVDIMVAELRVPILPGVAAAARGQAPAWMRLMRERHASLHVSKSAIDQCFSGDNVRISVMNAPPGTRHFFTKDTGMEVIVSSVALSLLVIEHEGLESKKWAWLNSREAAMPPLTITMSNAPDNRPPLEKSDDSASEIDAQTGIAVGTPTDLVGQFDLRSIESRETLMSQSGGPLDKPSDWTMTTYKSDVSLKSAARASISGEAEGEGGYAQPFASEMPRDSYEGSIMRHSSHPQLIA